MATGQNGLHAVARDHPAVRFMRTIEQLTPLDRLDDLVAPLADRLVADPRRRAALQGEWLGHALHPVMTDLPLGLWTSASVLDLLGGAGSRPAAQRLIGLGVAAALPTALTGWAEWATLGQRRERRTGVVHAVSNGAALVCYAASWRARRQGRHGAGAFLALVGAGAAGMGGYLGGHLTAVRKVSSYDHRFDRDGTP